MIKRWILKSIKFMMIFLILPIYCPYHEYHKVVTITTGSILYYMKDIFQRIALFATHMKSEKMNMLIFSTLF